MLGWQAESGERELRFRLGRLPLADGRFHLRFALTDSETGRLLHTLDDALRFFVFPGGSQTGAVLLDGEWSMQEIGGERANSADVSTSRTCPDWPALMELAPELQFRHFSLGEVQIPVDAFVQLEGVAVGHRRLL